MSRNRPHAMTNLTLSNLLSLARILLTVPILYFLSFNTLSYNSLALVLALLAAATDYLDGKLARHYGAVSALGKYLDPIADKILIGSLAIYLAFFRGNLPAWFAVLIIAKDLLIIIGGGILLLRNVVVHADPPGKYTVCIVALVFVLFVFNLDTAGLWSIVAAVLFALYSSYFYYLKFLALLHKSSSLLLRTILPALLLLLAALAGKKYLLH